MIKLWIFPRKSCQKPGVHPYIAMMTIRDMLTMRTCHDKTTYKAPGVTDWVASFLPYPRHMFPARNFSYDTSSTHTLGALIENLAVWTRFFCVLNFLDEIGFSANAYILKTPNGVSMGGSGLCATPYDLLKVIYLIANDGVWQGKQLLPSGYVRAAKSMQSDPLRQTVLT